MDKEVVYIVNRTFVWNCTEVVMEKEVLVLFNWTRVALFILSKEQTYLVMFWLCHDYVMVML